MAWRKIVTPTRIDPFLRIHLELTRAGYGSKQQLAAALGVCPSELTYLLNGKRKWTPERRAAAAAWFELTVEELFALAE